MRRLVARVSMAMAALVFLTACGTGSGKADISSKDLAGLARTTELSPREFTATEHLAGHDVEVSGVVEDDYRYQATVTIDGHSTYDEVVADDVRYVRVNDPAGLAPGADVNLLSSLDPAYAGAVTGKWVVDAKGAPAEFTSGNKPAAVPLAPQLVLERVRFLDTIGSFLQPGPKEWNVDSTTYLPKNDKFKAHKEAGKRFDLFPAAYDPNKIAVTLDDVATFFQFGAIWATPSGITRVEKHMELPDPKDSTYKELYGQISRAGSESFVNLVRMGPPGRLLTEVYEFTVDKSAKVTVPTDAITVDLNTALTKAATAFAPALKVPGPITGRPT